MIPENGKFVFISTVALQVSPAATVPIGTTHCVFGSTAFTDEAGFLAINLNGSTLSKLLVPLGEFVRVGNIVPGVSTVVTEATAPASTVTHISFFKWEQS